MITMLPPAGLLAAIGVAESRLDTVYAVLDKRRKVSDEVFAEMLGDVIAEDDARRRVTELMQAKTVEQISSVVEVGSDAGLELLAKHQGARDAAEEDLWRFGAVQEAKRPRFSYKLDVPVADLPNLLAMSYESPLWEELGEKCLGCGACTVVCPTCYCFHITDRLHLNLSDGQRVRVWDSCQLPQFAVVAGGEDFRESRADRQRHRFYRKGKYLTEMFGKAGCVGCGRCVRSCLVDIDPVDVFNTLHRTCAPGATVQPQGVD